MSEPIGRPDEEGSSRDRGSHHYSRENVRGNLGWYVLGRAISSVASIGFALLVVRELSIGDYSGYAVLTGAATLLFPLSNLGLERALPRYLPILRIEGAIEELRWLLKLTTGLRAAACIVVLAAIAAAYAPLARWLSIPDQAGLLLWFSLYFAGYALGQHLMRCLESLLLQRDVSAAVAFEWFGKLGLLLAWFVIADGLALVDVLMIQAVTSWAGALYMGFALAIRHPGQGSGTPAKRILDYAAARRLAWHSYVQQLIGVHATPAASRFIAVRMLGESATATLGFAHAVSDVVSRYLPAQLLIGLIEPTMNANFAARRDFHGAAKLAAIVFKVNLFVLVPFAVWLAVGSEAMLSAITKGKYGDSSWMLAILVIVLIMESHRLILHLIANALEESQLLVSSNLRSWLFAPLLLIGAYFAGIAGLLGGLCAIVFYRNAFLVRQLRTRGYPYHPDWAGAAKILAVALIAIVGANALVSNWLSGVGASTASGLLGATSFLLACAAVKPFRPQERDTLNRFLGRRLFVF